MTLIDRIKATTPMFNSPHLCPICGGRTTWEKRQQMAQNMKIHGYSIKEIKDIIEFAKEKGYSK